MTFQQQLTTQHDEAVREAQGLLSRARSQADSEGRAMTETEKSGIEAAVARVTALKARIKNAANDDLMRSAIDRLTDGMTGPSRSSNGTGGGGRRGVGSFGAQLVASEMGEWLLKHRGNFPTGAWTSPSSELMAATLTEDSASGGDLVIPDYRPGILPLPQRPLVVADLFAVGPTDSNLISYMKETTFTNSAAPVAELGTKPESTLVFDLVSDPVRKIAHHIPVTEEMIQDVPALVAYIDQRMRLGVQLKEDDQLINGTVTPPDIVGILNRTGLAASIARVAETNADAIAAQIAAIETATNLTVDGVILNPLNWQIIQLSKDSTGNYLGGGGPFAAPVQPTLWGRRVAITSNIVAGTALVGAFKTAAQIFRRGGIRVESTNSHGTDFIENRIRIRAEERLALCVYRASAFGTITNLL